MQAAQTGETIATMDEAATIERPVPANRLVDLGYNSPRNEGRVLTELNGRQQLLIEYMVFGVSNPAVARRIGTEPGTPLAIEQAADLCRIRRRNARRLSAHPVFQRAMVKAVADLRTGAHAKAQRRIIELVEEPEGAKAADRKVNLAAAMAVLGQSTGGQSNVNVTVGVNVTPGLVIRVRDPDQGEIKTIEGKVA